MLEDLDRRPQVIRRVDSIRTVSILPLVERYLETVESARFGPIAFASAPFGEKLGTEEILAHVDSNERDESRKLIDATGMKARYAHDLLAPFSLEDTVEFSAQIGAVLIDRVMQQRLWTNVDELIVSSAFLPQSVGRLAVERAGLDPEKVSIRNYRMFCAGAVAGFIDALVAADADPTRKNLRTIVLALEPLSAYLEPAHFTLRHAAIPGIFGNEFAGLGFIPKEINLLAAQTFIKSDGGVIKLRTYYEIPPHKEHLLPPHYRINSGDESIISASEDGVVLDAIGPEEDISASMDGEGTGLFFGTESPPLIRDILASLPPGIEVSKVVMHQPSAPVVRKIYNKLTRVLKLKVPEMPFLLGQMGRSNGSSATTIVTWQYMASHKMINNDDTLLIFAPAIRSAFCLAVAKLAKQFPIPTPETI